MTAAAAAGAGGLIGRGALATSRPVYLPDSRSRGSTVISVKDKGAVGDGVRDDTAAIQAAINALPSTGGTVVIPAGTYLIDTVKKINLRSLMLLKMDPNAILKAKTSSVSRASILHLSNVSDVEIAGGQLVGERATHRYMTTSTDEWNFGIKVSGKRVTVRDIRISDCTGDGICIGGGSTDVEISNVACTNNRRQGLSITNCSNIRVYDSEFSYTNGTAPECGIDIEPDAGYTCSDVLIENCRLNNNAKYGLNIWKNVTGVTMRRCLVEDNSSCGIATQGCASISIAQTVIRNNAATGLLINDGTNACRVQDNLSYWNYNRLGAQTRTPFTLVGWAAKIERDILIRGSVSGLDIGTNNYR